MSRYLDTIVELQEVMKRLDQAEARLNGIPDWMRELHGQYATRKAEIAELADKSEAAATERRTAERQIAEEQERLKHYQQQIALVRTQREYAALLQEIDTAKSQTRAFEDQAYQAMERFEQAQQQHAAAQQAFVELDERYAIEQAKWEAEKPAVAAEAERERERVLALRAALPPAVVARFQRLHERFRGQALAAIRRLDRAGRVPEIWACGVCNYRVRPQVVVEIRNQGSLLECDACKRIFYLAEGA
jgi:uncharacterized protein